MLQPQIGWKGQSAIRVSDLFLVLSQIEGIEDEAGMLEAVGAPVGRYRVPFVIVVGHPDRGAEAKRLSLFKDNRTPRFGMEQIISTDTLDKSGLLM